MAPWPYCQANTPGFICQKILTFIASERWGAEQMCRGRAIDSSSYWASRAHDQAGLRLDKQQPSESLEDDILCTVMEKWGRELVQP